MDGRLMALDETKDVFAPVAGATHAAVIEGARF